MRERERESYSLYKTKSLLGCISLPYLPPPPPPPAELDFWPTMLNFKTISERTTFNVTDSSKNVDHSLRHIHSLTINYTL